MRRSVRRVGARCARPASADARSIARIRLLAYSAPYWRNQGARSAPLRARHRTKQRGATMIVEERIYTLKVAGAPEWLRAYEAEGVKVQLAHLGNMVGYYSTEVGDLNLIVHMWAYESFEDRLKRRAARGGD